MIYAHINVLTRQVNLNEKVDIIKRESPSQKGQWIILIEDIQILFDLEEHQLLHHLPSNLRRLL